MKDFEGRGGGRGHGPGRGGRHGGDRREGFERQESERQGGGDRLERGRHKGHHHPHRHGAQTFRRGRALEFLDRLQAKSDVLKRQLESPQLQEIRPIVLGELKAVELMIEEFIRHFELRAAPEPGDANGPEDDAGPDANGDAETNEGKA